MWEWVRLRRAFLILPSIIAFSGLLFELWSQIYRPDLRLLKCVDVLFLPATVAQHTARARMPHFILIPIEHGRFRSTCDRPAFLRQSELEFFFTQRRSDRPTDRGMARHRGRPNARGGGDRTRPTDRPAATIARSLARSLARFIASDTFTTARLTGVRKARKEVRRQEGPG